ncbi:Hypothetical protein, putative [Bodo saltans]|uniref:BART domain-containing protein n=1 Tax=Bodo saltans TaxID=75058 RepID=A0A0S4ILU1_BODSA|nr:Hypothetical protein, putative [Bodo saltans]|eukprot:CUE60986.1 Hypothetical protein, putative [Bodo saltans]
MPIKSKPISEERKRAAAQGRLFSAGARRPAPVEDSSSTSSDDDASQHSHAKKPAAPPTSKVFVDPNEDFAVATKRAALQEWLYATGQSVPAPPPKPSANMQSPAAPRPRPVATQPPQTATPKPSSTTSITESKPLPDTSPARHRDEAAVATRRTLLDSQLDAKVTVVEEKDSTTALAEEVPPPRPADAVTDTEEASNPGRRDFLKLLDLFGDEPAKKKATTSASVAEPQLVSPRPASSDPPEQPAATVPHPTQHMTIDQLTEYHFDRLYQEWVQSEADVRFIAADEWHRAEAIAVLERAGTTDLATIHQQMRQKDNAHNGNAYGDNLRLQLVHDAALSRLEEYVMSGPFVRRVNQFLHKHHKLFLDTKPARERGEHQHKEYDVWQNYAQLMEQLVVGDLKRSVDDFEEQSFFDKLFEEQEERDAGGAASVDNRRRTVAGLSLEAWEVVLSFMRFEHFCDMMDEYIGVHYGVMGEGGSNVTNVVSALRRTSPPPLPSSSISSNGVSKSTATASVAPRTVSTPTVGPTRPTGGVSVKSKVAPKK